jgi:hypothetical protein
MLNEGFNLAEEFNKRVQRLSEGNLFRIKQMSNFVKFYNDDKKAMVECFRDSFVNQNGDIAKIMFECLTDVISTTFYKESHKENAYYILFSNLLYTEFGWMVKKFKTKQQIDIISNLIKSWSEKKWGPLKEAIYLKDFTEFLGGILSQHQINLEDENYVKQLDDDIYQQNFNSRANNFIMNGLLNPFIREYFNLDAKDKILDEQYRNNVNREEFINLMDNNDPNLLNRKKNVVIKFKPIFEVLKEKIIDQIVRRELFIKQLLKNRDQLYLDYEQHLKK